MEEKFIRVTPRLLREITDQIVAAVQPNKVILFGSYAYGKPTMDSDIDLLIVMESRQRPVERARVVSDLFPERHFGMDILVRTPQEVAQRLAIGDEFMRAITQEGKVLYERRVRSRVDSQSRNGLRKRARPRAASRAPGPGQGRLRLRAMR